jgi:hypothetical protein
MLTDSSFAEEKVARAAVAATAMRKFPMVREPTQFVWRLLGPYDDEVVV